VTPLDLSKYADEISRKKSYIGGKNSRTERVQVLSSGKLASNGKTVTANREGDSYTTERENPYRSLSKTRLLIKNTTNQNIDQSLKKSKDVGSQSSLATLSSKEENCTPLEGRYNVK
jgi:hypothetical protein